MSLAETLRAAIGPSVVRVGVTGLSRAGKTAFLTSVAGNLLALGAGLPALPALSARLAGRSVRISVAPAGAASLPRFDHTAHLAALARDPPSWPARTEAVSLLALDVELGRAGLAGALPSRRFRLEFLDYPGEWLLDLPLLAETYRRWSAAVLRRLEGVPEAARFLAFVSALPSSARADEALAAEGHDLYRALLVRLRETGLSYLQPGRFLMKPPGPVPPWMEFFPSLGEGGLARLLSERFEAYKDEVRGALMAPSFAQVDRLVVLADLLSALHAGPAAYADAARALGAAAEALRWQRSWLEAVPFLRDVPLPDWLRPWVAGGIRRVAFAATKADHVAARQRGNLAALVATLVSLPDEAAHAATRAFAVAAIRCTEDFVWTLEGRPVSAVRGRVLGTNALTRSYPGEVPDRTPDDTFWQHRFLALPAFEPMRMPDAGRSGVPQIGLDALLAWLLEDVL